MSTEQPRTWETYTYRCTRANGETYYMENNADLWFIRLYGYSDPIVRVRLTESPEGDYSTWFDTEKPDEPVMLAAAYLFPIQFTYGVQAEVDRGRGEAVNVTITELEEISR